MNSIWERVQIRRQTETIAPNYFILQNKNQLKPDIYLMLLQRSCCKGKQNAGKVQGLWFFKWLFALEGERKVKGLLKVSLNGDVKEQDFDFPEWDLSDYENVTLPIRSMTKEN